MSVNPSQEIPPLDPQEERNLSMVAHLSVWLHLVVPLLALAVPAVLYFVYRDRSREVAFHSLQALLFQLLTVVLGGTLAVLFWALTGALLSVVIGLLCVPFALLFSALPVAAVVYGTLGALEIHHQRPFRYPIVARWAEDMIQ